MIVLPKLTGKSSVPIAVGIFALIVITGAVLFATQPTHRVGAVVAPLLVIVVIGALLLKTVRLDPTAGRIETVRVLFLRQSLDLASVTRLAVAGNGANEAMLGLKGSGPRTFVSLLHLSDGIKRSLDAERLRALVGAVEQFVPEGAAGRGESIEALRAQAAFVEAGGAAAESPLAGMADGSLARAAGAAGAAASIFTLIR